MQKAPSIQDMQNLSRWKANYPLFHIFDSLGGGNILDFSPLHVELQILVKFGGKNKPKIAGEI